MEEARERVANPERIYEEIMGFKVDINLPPLSLSELTGLAQKYGWVRESRKGAEGSRFSLDEELRRGRDYCDWIRGELETRKEKNYALVEGEVNVGKVDTTRGAFDLAAVNFVPRRVGERVFWRGSKTYQQAIAVKSCRNSR